MKPFQKIVQLERQKQEVLNELLARCRSLETLLYSQTQKLSRHISQLVLSLKASTAKPQKIENVGLKSSSTASIKIKQADFSAWREFRQLEKETSNLFSTVSKLQALLESIEEKKLKKIRELSR